MSRCGSKDRRVRIICSALERKKGRQGLGGRKRTRADCCRAGGRSGWRRAIRTCAGGEGNRSWRPHACNVGPLRSLTSLGMSHSTLHIQTTCTFHFGSNVNCAGAQSTRHQRTEQLSQVTTTLRTWPTPPPTSPQPSDSPPPYPP